jgi:hypothetical protein
MKNTPQELAQSIQTEAINWIALYNAKSITIKELQSSILCAIWYATDTLLWYEINMPWINKGSTVYSDEYSQNIWHIWEEVWNEANIALLDFSNWLIDSKEVKKRVIDVLNQVIV